MKNSILFILSLFIFFAIPSSAQQQIQYDIGIDGVTCPFCVATSEKALKRIDGIELIKSDLETGTISVCGDPSLILEEQELTKLFLKKGFTFRSLKRFEGCSFDGENQDIADQIDDASEADVTHEHHSQSHSHE